MKKLEKLIAPGGERSAESDNPQDSRSERRAIKNGCEAEPDPWFASARYLLAWVFPALMGIYVKWYILADQHGFALVARSLGRDALAHEKHLAAGTLSLVEKLSFFRGEILVGFLVIPVALLILNRYLRPAFGALLTGVVSFGVVFLFMVQLRALEEVGRFISFNMLLVALTWGWHEPGGNIGYLATMKSLLPLTGLAFVLVATRWAYKKRQAPIDPASKIRWKIAGELHFAAALALVVISWQATIPSTPYHESSFARSLVSLYKENVVDTGEFAGFDFQRVVGVPGFSLTGLSEPALMARYRELVHAPTGSPDPRYFGKEEGSSVIFFDLETASYKLLPPGDDLHDMPNLKRLESKSFEGMQHYTTLPNTYHALFSVFSSWYPEDGMKSFAPNRFVPDFLHRLSGEGYETAVFSPTHWPGGLEYSLFDLVDFKEQFAPNTRDPLPSVAGYAGQPEWKAKRIGQDLATLAEMKLQIENWLTSGKKFAVAFTPQVGHSPYPDLGPDDVGADLVPRGRAMIAMQDAWLGDLLDLLKKYGQLDKTVIVVFGDHGTRTQREDPTLRRGTIDESSFHVPFYLYAPRTLNHAETIPWLTSHIDVAPTVLDLLGAKEGRESEQGSPIWNSGIADRTTFFFAEPIFGADGYYSHGKFFMWHYLSDVVYENSSASFDTSDILPRSSPIAHNVTTSILTMIGIERAWLARFTQPIPRTTASKRK